MTVPKRFFFEVLRSNASPILPGSDLGREIDVIQGGHRPAKPACAEKLLCVEAAVRLAKLDVVLARKIAESNVPGHIAQFTAPFRLSDLRIWRRVRGPGTQVASNLILTLLA